LTELILNPREGLPITLFIEPFAFELELGAEYVYKLSSEETTFTIEHRASSLTICFDKEVDAILYRRPQTDEAMDMAAEWEPYMKFV